MGAPRHAAHRQSPARPLEDDDLSGCPAQRRIDAPWVLDGPIDGESFRIYEKVLLPTLQPGEILIIDNLGNHRGKAVRQLILAVCRKLLWKKEKIKEKRA